MPSAMKDFCLVQDMVQRLKRADFIAELLRVNTWNCQHCLVYNSKHMSGEALFCHPEVPG